MSQKSAYERRRTLALKWHHLENLDNAEIRQRFIDEGFGEFRRETISRYLNSEPEEEVMERILDDQAHVREESIERLERKHERSRQAEIKASKNIYKKAIRPVDDRNTTDHPIHVPGWNVLEGDDRPDEAGPDDVFIKGTGDLRVVEPGEPYYVLDPENNPRYETQLVEIVRDEPDRDERRGHRMDQVKIQTDKATVAGAYEEQHHHTHEGSIAVGELSAEQEQTFEELTGAPGENSGPDGGEGNVE